MKQVNLPLNLSYFWLWWRFFPSLLYRGCRRDLKDSEFALLSFSIDANGRKILPEFIRKHKINYPVILDADQKFARHFSVLGVPENIIIAKDGTVAEKRYGSEDWTDSEIRKVLTDLIQK